MPFGAQWENPARKPSRPVRFDQNTVGLLQASIVYMPFGSQWENPWRRVYRPPAIAVAGSLGLVPVYVDREPTITKYQKKPTLNPSFSWNASLALTVTPGAKPFLQNEWPNPAPKRWWRFDYQQGGCGRALTTVVVKPFLQNQWPNPLPPKWWRFDHSQAGAGLALSTVQAATRRAPLVTRYEKPKRLDPSFSTSASLALTVVAGPKPFNTLQWPNPVLRKPEMAFGCNPVLTLSTNDLPFNLYEWPNPLPRKWWRFDHTQAGAGRALTTVIVKPFNYSDWQNPRLKLVPQQPQIAPVPPMYVPVVTPPDPSGPPADPPVVTPSSGGGKHEDEKHHHPRGMLLPQKKKAGHKKFDDIELVVKPEQTQIAKAVGAIDARSFYVEPPKPLTPMERLEARVAELEVMVAKAALAKAEVEEEQINDDEEAMAVILKALYE